MLILALDTSGDVCSLCLSEGARARGVSHFRHERRLSERLPRLVEFVLRDAGVALRDVEAFAVGRGPGSFTGVRVAVTTAKTLAHALRRPLVGVSSLDALAEPFGFLKGAGIVTLAPARRGEVVAGWDRGGEGEGVAPAGDPALVPVGEVLPRASHLLGDVSCLLVCGEAVSAYPQLESATVSARPTFVSAASVASLAALRLQRGESDDPFTLTPLYVAPSPVG